MNRNKGSVVTFHGSILKTPKFSEKHTVSHFAREVPSDIPVTIGGTGVMAYNTANVEIDFGSFKCDFWADGWFAIQATETGVPIIALRHEQGGYNHYRLMDQIYGVSTSKKSVLLK